MSTIGTFAGSAILAAFKHKSREIQPTINLIMAHLDSRSPFSAPLRAQLKTGFAEISARKVPKTKVLKDQDRYNAGATLSLLFLVEFMGFAREHRERDETALTFELVESTELIEPLKRAWPHIWAWIQWFHTSVASVEDPQGKMPAPLRDISRRTIARTLYVFTFHGQGLPSLILEQARTLLPMIVFYYMQDPVDTMFASRIIEVLTAVKELDKPKEHDKQAAVAAQIVEAAKGDGKDGATRLASKIVAQLKHYLSSPVPWNYEAAAGIRTLFILLESLMVDNAIRDAFMGAKVIPTTIRVIMVYCDKSAPVVNALTSNVVRKAVSFLRTVRTAMRDSAWIPQAIKSKLIPAILKSVRVTNGDPFDGQHAMWMVEVFLPQSLVILSCLEMIQKSCETAEVIQLGQDEAALGPLWQPWCRFLELKDRFLYAMTRQAQTGVASLFRCSNNSCTVRAHKEKLKTCKRCRKGLYCSVECQSADRQNHKPHCHEYSEYSREEEFSRLPRSDLSFANYMTTFETHRQHDIIASLIWDYYSQNPLEDEIVVEADFTMAPFPAFRLAKFKDGLVYDGSYQDLLAQSTQFIPSEGSRQFIIHGIIQNGKYLKSVFSGITLEMDEFT